jgi:high frequency lysogenization protein
MRTRRDRAIALAGVFQSAWLVERIARHGSIDSAPLCASLRSVFQLEPESVDDIFEGPAGVERGLRCLQAQLGAGPGRNLEIVRYVLGLLHLERKASRNAPLMLRIRRELELGLSRLEYFPVDHPNTVASLAELYRTTIGSLQPRIMVQGEPLYLRSPKNVERIRAVLLAGIRAALLWRQCGGNRLQILFGRRHLLGDCQRLLTET